MKLSDGSIEVALARVDSAAGQFPPPTKTRVDGVLGVKEQHHVPGVEHDEANRAAFEDGQIVRQWRGAFGMRVRPQWRVAGPR
ncbi:MAG: hypothetical protein ACR2M5_02355 [Nakamurella sp.]